MGRELRRVKPGWIHPRNESGNPVPLMDYTQAELDKVNAEYLDEGDAPLCADGCMPMWDHAEATVFMIYEDTPEGTPLSDREFATPEDAAKFAYEAKLSVFGDRRGSYEWWLGVLRDGQFSGLLVHYKDGTVEGSP